NVSVTGSAISFTQSATLGDSFTIEEDGIYSIQFNSPCVSAGSGTGIRRNGTTIGNSSYASGQLAYSGIPVPSPRGPPEAATELFTTAVLSAGDVLRACSDPGCSSNGANYTHFVVVKIGD